jgi:hypothetical protein
MVTGQLVKFTHPVDDSESHLVMKVLELRGDRVLVEYILNMPYNPTANVVLSDIEVIEES